MLSVLQRIYTAIIGLPARLDVIIGLLNTQNELLTEIRDALTGDDEQADSVEISTGPVTEQPASTSTRT